MEKPTKEVQPLDQDFITEEPQVEAKPEVTENEALEGLRRGDQDPTYQAWKDQEMQKAIADRSDRGRLLWEVKVARLEHAAGNTQEALTRLKSVSEGAAHKAEELRTAKTQTKEDEIARLNDLQRMEEIQQGAEWFMREIEKR